MIRQVLLRVPILGGWVERRWMPDPAERDAHREIVRERLDRPMGGEGQETGPATEEIAGQ